MAQEVEIRFTGESRSAVAASRAVENSLKSVERQAEHSATQIRRSLTRVHVPHINTAPAMASMTRLANHVNQMGSRMGSALRSMARVGTIALTSLLAPIGLLSAAIGGLVAKSGTQFFILQENAQIAFTTMLGSAKEARDFMAELSEFAARTPFELPQLTQAAQQFLNAGAAAKDVIPVMTAVGDAVSAAGGDPVRMESTVRAITQIQAKGRLMSEEMMQLNEAGTFSWRALAREIGTSVPEAQAQVTAGAVSASEFMTAFLENSRKSFGGMMEAMSHTLSGVWSTFKDTFGALSAEVVGPSLKIITDRLGDLNVAMGNRELQQRAKELGDSLAGGVERAIEGIERFIDLMGELRHERGFEAKVEFVWEAIQPDLIDLRDRIQETLFGGTGAKVMTAALVSAMVGGFDIALAAIDWGVAGDRIAEAIGGALEFGAEHAREFVESIIGAFVANAPLLAEFALELGTELAKGIVSGFGAALESGLTGVFGAALGTLVTAAASMRIINIAAKIVGIPIVLAGLGRIRTAILTMPAVAAAGGAARGAAAGAAGGIAAGAAGAGFGVTAAGGGARAANGLARAAPGLARVVGVALGPWGLAAAAGITALAIGMMKLRETEPDEVARGLEDLGTSLTTLEQGLEDIEQAEITAADARLATERATVDLTRAENELADAQAEVQAAKKPTEEQELRVREARLGVAEATNRLRQAEVNERDATESLTAARQKQSDETNKAQGQIQNLVEAHRRQADAIRTTTAVNMQGATAAERTVAANQRIQGSLDGLVRNLRQVADEHKNTTTQAGRVALATAEFIEVMHRVPSKKETKIIAETAAAHKSVDKILDAIPNARLIRIRAEMQKADEERLSNQLQNMLRGLSSRLGRGMIQAGGDVAADVLRKNGLMLLGRAVPTKDVQRSLWDEIGLAQNMGMRIVSTYRPGATVRGSGSKSDHSYYPSKAIDVAGTASQMRAFAIALTHRPGLRQIIYSPLGIASSGGAFSPLPPGPTKQDHYDHVHVGAYEKGGFLGSPRSAGLGRAMRVTAHEGEVILNPLQQRLVGMQKIMAVLARTGGKVGGAQFQGGGMIAAVRAILQAAQATGLSPLALLAVALQESGLDPGAEAAGAEQSYGLFQFNLAGEGAGIPIAKLLDPIFNAMTAARRMVRKGVDPRAGILQQIRQMVTLFERPAGFQTPGVQAKYTGQLGRARQIFQEMGGQLGESLGAGISEGADKTIDIKKLIPKARETLKNFHKYLDFIPEGARNKVKGDVARLQKLLSRVGESEETQRLRARLRKLNLTVMNEALPQAVRYRAATAAEKVKKALKSVALEREDLSTLRERLKTLNQMLGDGVSDATRAKIQRQAARIRRILRTGVVTQADAALIQRLMNNIGRAVERGMERARRAAEKARGQLEEAFGRVASKALDAFDRVTEQRMEEINARYEAQFAALEKTASAAGAAAGAFERPEIAETPSERRLRLLQEAREEEERLNRIRERAKRIQEVNRTLAEANQRLAELYRAGAARADIEAAIKETAEAAAQAEETRAAVEQETREEALQAEIDALEESAEQEREAAEKALDAQEEAFNQQQQAAEEAAQAALDAQREALEAQQEAEIAALEDQRAYQREHFERELEALQKRFATGKIDADKAQKELLALFEKYNVPFGEAGNDLGTFFSLGFIEAVNEMIRAIEKLNAAVRGQAVPGGGAGAGAGAGAAPQPQAFPQTPTGALAGGAPAPGVPTFRWGEQTWGPGDKAEFQEYLRRTPGGPTYAQWAATHQPTVQRLGWQRGGIAWGPLLRLIGEAGPEAVLPVGGRAATSAALARIWPRLPEPARVAIREHAYGLRGEQGPGGRTIIATVHIHRPVLLGRDRDVAREIARIVKPELERTIAMQAR
jgi:tape measure domain-containing protein